MYQVFDYLRDEALGVARSPRGVRELLRSYPEGTIFLVDEITPGGTVGKTVLTTIVHDQMYRLSKARNLFSDPRPDFKKGT